MGWDFEIVSMSCFYYETARNMPMISGKDFILLTKMILMYYRRIDTIFDNKKMYVEVQRMN